MKKGRIDHEVDLTIKVQGAEEVEGAERGICMSSIIARLCRSLEQTGSLARTCKAEGVAYSASWKRFRAAEAALGEPLIVRMGVHGSRLTPFARQLLAAYTAAEEAAAKAFEAALVDQG